MRCMYVGSRVLTVLDYRICSVQYEYVVNVRSRLGARYWVQVYMRQTCLTQICAFVPVYFSLSELGV